MKYLLITTDDAQIIAKHLPEGQLKERLETDAGGDFEEISEKLRKLDFCFACGIEGQEHDCESLVANKLGRRLRRLIWRAQDGMGDEAKNNVIDRNLAERRNNKASGNTIEKPPLNELVDLNTVTYNIQTNRFILDQHDAGYYLARGSNEAGTYPIGYDKDLAQRIIALLNEAHRPNLDVEDHTLKVCWNQHDKGMPCEYVTLVENAF